MNTQPNNNSTHPKSNELNRNKGLFNKLKMKNMKHNDDLILNSEIIIPNSTHDSNCNDDSPKFEDTLNFYQISNDINNTYDKSNINNSKQDKSIYNHNPNLHPNNNMSNPEVHQQLNNFMSDPYGY